MQYIFSINHQHDSDESEDKPFNPLNETEDASEEEESQILTPISKFRTTFPQVQNDNFIKIYLS